MSIPPTYSFSRYLAAKKGLDDRSVNLQVFQALKRALQAGAGPAPLKVLEVGCGLGTMVERLLDWGLFGGSVDYTGIDLDPGLLAAARERLCHYASQRGYSFSTEGESIHVQPAPEAQMSVRLEAADFHDFLPREPGRPSWDLLLAHAFLDLADLPTALPLLVSGLNHGGYCYFTLNFDGATTFLPTLDPELDRLIEELYHQGMDQRLIQGRPSGHSRTGRRLFQELPAAGVRILAAGASDWVVHPGPEGYPGDEAYFLHFIVHTVEGALTGHPQLPAPRFRDWVAARHRQIDDGELLYLARQLDFLGIFKGASLRKN